jgi:hypothetical protein
VALSDFVAPTVIAAVIGGGMSYLVAKATAKSTIESASISATVEREKLAHSREEWRASRRDKALNHLIALNGRMEIVANTEIVVDSREGAAREAQTSLAAVVLTLRDDAGDSGRVNDLVKALRLQNLERAVEIWSEVRDSLMSGKLV